MIKSIKLTNFRLFENKEISVNNSFVIFSGKNATGKTSILEAIYIAATTKSERTNDLTNVITFNKDFSKIEIVDDKRYKVTVSKDGKGLFINNREIKKTGEYIGNLNICMISPSDISLVNGSKYEKRRFLDLNISLLDKMYLNTSGKYKKLLSERNALLKEKSIDSVMLNVLTSDLSDSLKIIYEARINFLNKLNNYLDSICNDMHIEKIKLVYEPTYNPDDILKSYESKLQYDMFNKITSIGSHRDSFKILIDNNDASLYASEGQSRIIYIAIKLALKKIITESKGEPILLLDDIFQALDNTRIRSLTKYVKESKQVFITTTSVLDIPDDILSDSVVIRIEN